MPIGPMRNARSLLSSAGLLLVLVMIGGCATPTNRSVPTQSADDSQEAVSAIDPCARNLEDISGAMLMHLNLHGRFPTALDELQPPPGTPALSFDCPVSGQPYIFNPTGIHLAERAAYIIVYDARPSHDGRRWAIIMDEPQADKAFVMDVQQIPESLFLLHPSN